ncbi:TonB family protein [Mesorhizobium sp. AR10]|uniref:cell envelope integrity protein TolA n=1 Tax=Mesorhizobium sp. AR10 TaxID=2865839 RepID=UPI0021606545|nr:TonB family protein [Mesorhizobium sp. AR10]UVK36509.1 TonB family protein [Mesorhizobium sp. AR10]
MTWPLAGPFVLPLEPDDPDFTIPHGSLQSSLRDTPEKNYIADGSGELTTIPAEPLSVTRTRQPSRKWKAAVVFSLVLHVAAAMAFLATGDEPVLIEGADQSVVMLLGNAPEDQSAAGDMTEAPPEATKVTLVTMLAPKPVETVEAQTVVATETTQPVETTEAEAPDTATLEPLREAPERPTSAPDRVDPVPDEPATATTVDPLPEILTADQLQTDDNSVRQRAVQAMTTVEATEAIPEKTAPVETFEKVPAETEPQPAPAEKKPQPLKPQSEKPKKAEPEKKPIKKAQKAEAQKNAEKASEKPSKKVRAGSGGQNEADAKRGVAEGETEGKTATRSQGGKSGVGNASVSNYPGKVAAKLRRAVRGIPRSARAKARNDVQVSFTVNANGGVGGIRVARSSGSPELDAAALAVVRRAAPFPPIPADAGRSSWAFALPLGLAR